MLYKKDKLIPVFILILTFSLFAGRSYAWSPQDECNLHTQNNEPGSCNPCGEQCVKKTNNMGFNIYKKCSDAQCEQTNDCATDCPSCECNPSEG